MKLIYFNILLLATAVVLLVATLTNSSEKKQISFEPEYINSSELLLDEKLTYYFDTDKVRILVSEKGGFVLVDKESSKEITPITKFLTEEFISSNLTETIGNELIPTRECKYLKIVVLLNPNIGESLEEKIVEVTCLEKIYEYNIEEFNNIN